MSIRILHAADLHLDAAFEGLPPEKAVLRRAEFRRLPGQIAAEAKNRGAEVLFLAGDVFDSDRVYPETLEALAAALSSLTIPVFIAPGNHDFYSLRSPWQRLKLPENVHIFTQPRLECVPLPELGVNVWGAGYTSNACAPLLRSFRAPASDGLDLLLLHAEVDRAGSSYCPVTEAELAASGFTYAALGHVHSSSGLRRAGDCSYAWPGCAAGRGFDECGEKGVLMAEVSAENVTASFVPLHAREYREMSIPAGENALAAVLAALPEDAARHLYRITLTGQTNTPPDISALTAALSDEVFDLTLLDATTREDDVWAAMGEDTLRGLFLRRMRSRLDAAEGEGERQLLLESVRLGLTALDGREGPV